jgi:hypothetical protein
LIRKAVQKAKYSTFQSEKGHLATNLFEKLIRIGWWFESEVLAFIDGVNQRAVPKREGPRNTSRATAPMTPNV